MQILYGPLVLLENSVQHFAPISNSPNNVAGKCPTLGANVLHRNILLLLHFFHAFKNMGNGSNLIYNLYFAGNFTAVNANNEKACGPYNSLIPCGRESVHSHSTSHFSITLDIPCLGIFLGLLDCSALVTGHSR